MMKVREKISGTFRSVEHTQGFCDIRSVISKLKKQGISVIVEMLNNTEGMFNMWVNVLNILHNNTRTENVQTDV